MELNHRNDREFRAPASNSMKSPESNLPGHDRRAVASFKIRRWIFAARSDPPGGQLGKFVPHSTSEPWRQPSLADHPRSLSQSSPRTQDRDVVLSNRLPVPTNWAREYPYSRCAQGFRRPPRHYEVLYLRSDRTGRLEGSLLHYSPLYGCDT